jgi:hypothetical protein
MLRLSLTLPMQEQPRLRSLRRAPPSVQEPEIPAVGSALLLSDGGVFALAGDQAAFDLAIHYASDRTLGDLPIRTEAALSDLLLVHTSAGSRKITLGDLLDSLET